MSNNTTTLVVSDPTCRDIDHALSIIALVLLPVILMFTIATWQSVYGKVAYITLYVVSLLAINTIFKNNANGLLEQFASANINSLALRLLPVGGAILLVLGSFLWELGNWFAPFVVFVFILVRYDLMVISIASGVVACLVCILMRCWKGWENTLRTFILVIGNLFAFCVLFTGWFNKSTDTGCQEERNMLVVCNETCKVCTDNLPFTLGLYAPPVVIEAAALVSVIIIKAWFYRRKKQQDKKRKQPSLPVTVVAGGAAPRSVRRKYHQRVPSDEIIERRRRVDSDDDDDIELHDVDLES